MANWVSNKDPIYFIFDLGPLMGKNCWNKINRLQPSWYGEASYTITNTTTAESFIKRGAELYIWNFTTLGWELIDKREDTIGQFLLTSTVDDKDRPMTDYIYNYKTHASSWASFFDENMNKVICAVLIENLAVSNEVYAKIGIQKSGPGTWPGATTRKFISTNYIRLAPNAFRVKLSDGYSLQDFKSYFEHDGSSPLGSDGTIKLSEV